MRVDSMKAKVGKRLLLRGALIGAIGTAVAGSVLAETVQWRPWSPGQERPWLPGERYEAEAPDTLDLTQYADLGLNAVMGQVDVAAPANGEIWIANVFNANPPYMMHMYSVGSIMGAKSAEPLAGLRVMTGSALNLEVEKMMVDWLVRGLSKEDGLLYSLAKPERPWYAFNVEGVDRLNNQVGTKSPGKPMSGGDQDMAFIYAQIRMMNFMMEYYQYTKDPAWKERIDKLVIGIDSKMAVHKQDPPDSASPDPRKAKRYAYMPSGAGVNNAEYGSCMPRAGWKEGGREPGTESDGANEGSVFMDLGPYPGVLARWHALSGSEKALELATEFKNFLMLKKFWGTEKDPCGKEAGAELAHFEGHFFGRIEAYKGLLEYAMVTHDAALKEFVRNGYEWIRHSNCWPSNSKPVAPIPAIGFFDAHCGCTTPRVVALAIRLIDAGLGDYWEDVDRYVRNFGAEIQLRDPALLKKILEKKPASVTRPGIDSTDRVIERSLGSYPVTTTPTDLLLARLCFSGTCCLGHHNHGYFYAWEGIVRSDGDGVARVNLLLNRASPWLDVDSYLPYEGKVVVHNKTAKTLFLRIPMWADRKAVQCARNGKPIPLVWIENYLFIPGLAPQDTISAEFPMAERTEQYHGYTIQFKGNTVVDIAPRMHKDQGDYPIFLRDEFKATKAPIKKVTRYVSPLLIKW